MKKQLLFALFSLCIPWSAWAQTFTATTAEGVEMKFSVTNSTTKECIVYGTSSTPSIPKNYSGAITIPEEVNGYKVTSISSDAFYNCSSLTSVSIPEGVTSIGFYAFYNCSSLTSISIPKSMTRIYTDAFSGCSGLISVHTTDLTAWCNATFESNPLSHAHHLFLNGEEVKDLIIPNNVTSIGYGAFSGCSGLTSITIPNSVISIEASAFFNCSNLTSVTIPNSVTSIGSSAFSSCI